MNDGVKILLERMQTHPEEFVDETNLGATKWSGVLNYYDNVLTLEEKKAIQEGVLKLKRDAFTKQVMEILLEEPVKIDPDTFTIKTAGRYAFNAPTTMSNHIRLGQETLDEDTITHMKEHLKQLKLAGKI